MRNRRLFQPDGLWLMTLAASTWGTIGVATQAIYQIDTTTSLFINLARMLVATPVLLLICWRMVGPRMFNVQRRDLLLMLIAGGLLAISQAAYFAAIRYTGVTITTLLTICIAPVVVMGLSVLLRLEKMTGRLLASLGCALVGSVLLVGFSSADLTQDQLVTGTLFSLIAAGSYAGTIICGRFLAAHYHALQITTISFFGGTLLLAAINLASGIVAVHTVESWLLIVYLGLVPTAFAYWLFQAGLRSVSAVAASIVSMLEPLVATLLAWALFGETLAASGVIGAGLLILSITLLSRTSDQPA
ncbi:MAG: EamA family transporter [Anaerolineaceae bacterium]|nr:EamA family transporter [Anaerolineaceae bacterium]